LLQRQLAKLGWPVSPATLSNWRNGRTLPTDVPGSRARVMALEAVLDLPPGQLVRAWYDSRLREGERLPGTRTPSPAARLHAPADPLHNDNKETRKNAMFRRIETDSPGGWLSRNYLVPIQVEEDFQVGPDGLPLRSTITLTIYAMCPGVDQYWYVYAFRGTDPAVGVRVTPHAGCRLGEKQLVDDGAPAGTVNEVTMATQLRFKELEPFTTHRLSYRVEYDYPERFTGCLRPEFIRVVPTPGTRQLRLSIAFDNRARPQRLTRCLWTPDPAKPDGGFDTPVRQPDLRGARSDQFTVMKPRTPQGYGWTWSDPADQPRAVRTHHSGRVAAM
jgi:transcriptional regulator with XRE-family HTH domain